MPPPPPPLQSKHHNRVEPQWNVSEAQRLLDYNIEARKHLRMNPKELHETKDGCKLFNITTSRWHIEQSTRTAKYKHTSKLTADAKLKKKMVKYDLGDVDVNEP